MAEQGLLFWQRRAEQKRASGEKSSSTGLPRVFCRRRRDLVCHVNNRSADVPRQVAKPVSFGSLFLVR